MTHWMIDKEVDLQNDSIEYLSQRFPIVVGRDFHGSKCYEHHSLFTYLTDMDDLETLMNRFGDDHLLSYRNPDGGNILHDLVQNPNTEALARLCGHVGEYDIYMMANETDNFNCKPLAYNSDFDTFKWLMGYTEFTGELLTKCVQSNRKIADFLVSILDGHVFNDYRFENCGMCQ